MINPDIQKLFNIFNEINGCEQAFIKQISVEYKEKKYRCMRETLLAFCEWNLAHRYSSILPILIYILYLDLNGVNNYGEVNPEEKSLAPAILESIYEAFSGMSFDFAYKRFNSYIINELLLKDEICSMSDIWWILMDKINALEKPNYYCKTTETRINLIDLIETYKKKNNN